MLYTHDHWSKARPLHLQIGLAISLALMLVAFEWKSAYIPYVTQYPDLQKAWQPDEVIPPITIYSPPPPPPKKMQKPVLSVEALQVPVEFQPMPEMEEAPSVEEVINSLPVTAEVPEEDPTEIIDFAQEAATFPGGNGAFLKFLASQLKYPHLAKRTGTEGIVYVQFVVNLDGSLSDMKVLRGIGGGCDEEALRVLQLSPKWKAARHGGRPARMRMTLPVRFRLQ